MKVSTLIGWGIVALMTLFIFANWRHTNINLLPGVWLGDLPLSVALLMSGGMGFAAAVFLRAMNKDRK